MSIRHSEPDNPYTGPGIRSRISTCRKQWQQIPGKLKDYAGKEKNCRYYSSGPWISVIGWRTTVDE